MDSYQADQDDAQVAYDLTQQMLDDVPPEIRNIGLMLEAEYDSEKEVFTYILQPQEWYKEIMKEDFCAMGQLYFATEHEIVGEKVLPETLKDEFSEMPIKYNGDVLRKSYSDEHCWQ